MCFFFRYILRKFKEGLDETFKAQLNAPINVVTIEAQAKEVQIDKLFL